LPNIKLGVLSLYLRNGVFEEQTFFRRLSIAGKQIGVDVFVFAPSNVDEKNQRIHAHAYMASKRRWGRQWISYPDLFIDRSRFHSVKRYRESSGFRKRNPQLTFISSPLANKWNLYQQLSSKPAIKPYLPSTVLYRTFDDLRRELMTKRVVFLKPINGTGGRDILKIAKLQDGLYSVQGRMLSRKIIPERKINLLQLRSVVIAKKPANRYIIQQGIDLRLKSGSVHDYRLLIQKNSHGKWEITGCVGRVGPAGSITSNLHGGGRAVPMRKLLQHWFGSEKRADAVAQNIHHFAFLLSEALETIYGQICELALDIAVAQDGKIWLLEVNSKPAREVFNKVGDRTAYMKAIRRPVEYAKWLYKSKAGEPL
jgi:hypothetical protein